MELAHYLLIYSLGLKLFASGASAFYAWQIVKFKTSSTHLWVLLYAAFSLRFLQVLWSLQFYADIKDIYARINFEQILVNNLIETAVVLTFLGAVATSFFQFKRRET